MYIKKINIVKIKLLTDINPNTFEMNVGICGKILIMSKNIDHKIQTIESDIARLFLEIFFIMKANVNKLAKIKTHRCNKLILSIYLSKRLDEEY